jgi:drug/metabolite transporter (DMT)-like permease
VALCVVGALSLAVATLTLRDASAGGGLLTVVGWQMLVGAAALTLAAAFETPEVRWSPALGLAFAYTVLVPGLLATLTWFVLVRRIGAVRASAFHFLNPPLGVAFAAVLLGEAVGPWDLVGVAVTAAGILMVQLAREG